MLLDANTIPEVSRTFLAETDPNARRQLATDIRDSIEIAHTSEYPNFLKNFFPAFQSVFRSKGEITVEFHTPEQRKLRNVVLEILNRLPHSDALNPYVQDLLELAVEVVQRDTEENAVICMHIIFDLLKTYRRTLDAQFLEKQIHAFMGFLKKLYDNFNAAVETTFLQYAETEARIQADRTPQPDGTPATTSDDASRGTLQLPAVQSLDSFKVVTECPFTVAILFQLYPKHIHPSLQDLLPVMVKSIEMEIPENDVRRKSAMYTDFVLAQVKTLSFLFYPLRVFPDMMRPYKETIPKCFVRLLLNCPSDGVGIRRELLVATRHILSTEFREGFFSQIDTLLDENILLGTGQLSSENLRPLAYSFLAELVNSFRGKLSQQQLARAIHLFSMNVHDPTLSYSMQTTSVRLLLNLIEMIYKVEDRALLFRLMETIVNKFVTLKRKIPDLFQTLKEQTGSDGKDRLREQQLLTGSVAAASAAAAQAEAVKEARAKMTPELLKEVNDCKQLIRMLVIGLRTLMWSLKHLKSPTLAEDEHYVICKLLRSGLKAMALYANSFAAGATEEKEILDGFAQVFTLLEPRNFQDIFSQNLDWLFERICENQVLLTVPQHYLANTDMSKYFAEILLTFLVKRLDTLSDPEVGSVLLKLFKVLFASVSLHPHNEPVLRPHLANIVTSALSQASKVSDPYHYFQLLRSLFKSIAGGKFETLYKEFMPLLQTTLEGLIRHQEGPHKHMRDLLVELCLTIPARPTSILPYLPLLMRPVVRALHSSNELVSLGLRTVEFWIDNLQPEFLEPIVDRVNPEFMLGLWQLLKPTPFVYGPMALRILGKLGGRNRKFLLEPLALPYRKHPEDGLVVHLKYSQSSTFSVTLDRQAEAACKLLTDPPADLDIHIRRFMKRQAFLFLCTCLAPMLTATKGSDRSEAEASFSYVSPDTAATVEPEPTKSPQKKKSSDAMTDEPVESEIPEPTFKSSVRYDAECAMFTVVLRGILFAGADSDLNPESRKSEDGNVFVATGKGSKIPQEPPHTGEGIAEALVSDTLMNYGLSPLSCARDLMKYFAALLVVRAPDRQHMLNHTLLKPSLFLEVLTDGIAEENDDVAKTTLDLLGLFIECVVALVPRREHNLLQVPVLEEIANLLMHSCRKRSWHHKRGGSLGLKLLLDKLPILWIRRHEADFVRSLLFVLKDIPKDMGALVVEETTATLTLCLKKCNDPELAPPGHPLPAQPGPNQPRSPNDVISILAAELTTSDVALQDTVRTCLEDLTKMSKTNLSDVLSGLVKSVLQPVFQQRSLRILPFSVQTGYVRAVTYFLNIRPRILTATPEVLHLVKEALEFAQDPTISKLVADEVAFNKLVENKLVDPKIAQSLTLLRKVCIELLCAVMGTDEFGQPEHADTRKSIIAVFFKALTSRCQDIVSVAKVGLSQVVSTKLPKDLLQESLRPILSNLAEYKRLSVPYLQGLSRLLELLSNWFNVTLGEKLLEHLRRWTDPKAIVEAKVWKPGEEYQVASHIIELFHLLPRVAVKFLDQLVTIVIQLQGLLTNPPAQHSAAIGTSPVGSAGVGYSEVTSPYREPLCKFLNRYPDEAVEYFLHRLAKPVHQRLFISILRLEIAKPLREKLSKCGEDILKHAFDVPQTQNASPEACAHAQRAAVIFVHLLAKSFPNWLSENKPVLRRLMDLWTRARLFQLQQQDAHEHVKETVLLVKCFVIFCKECPQEAIGTLFDMLAIFSVRTLTDFSFLRTFYLRHVALEYTVEQRSAILEKFLVFFEDPQISQDHKVQALQLLVMPIVQASFEKLEDSQQLLTQPLVTKYVTNLLNPPPERLETCDEALRCQLLQLSTLLIKHMSKDLSKHSKVLIKFGWNHLKRDKTMSQQWAFVNVCHFFNASPAPEDIILQVYVALLNTAQPETRRLVRQALDVLTPVLPHRLTKKSGHKYPIWICYTKKILVEEGHSLPHLVHIWQLLVRHADLFYESRAQFVPQMVHSLNRLGAAANCPAENRRLAVDLADLIISWEEKRLKSGDIPKRTETPASSPAPSPASSVAASPMGALPPAKRMRTDSGMAVTAAVEQELATKGRGSSRSDEDFRPSAGMCDMVVNFLVRVSFLTLEVRDAASLSTRCKDLVARALLVWKSVSVKLHYLEKVLLAAQEKQTTLAFAVEILDVIVRAQGDSFVRPNAVYIAKIVDPCFEDPTRASCDHLCSLLRRLVTTYRIDSASGDLANMYRDVKQHVSKVLEAKSLDAQQSEKFHLTNALRVLDALSSGDETVLDPYIGRLLVVVRKLSDSMATHAAHARKQSSKYQLQGGSYMSTQMETVLDGFTLSLKLISRRVLGFPSSRAEFLVLLQTLVSAHNNTFVGSKPTCSAIIGIVSTWLLGSPDKPVSPGRSTAPTLSLDEKVKLVLMLAVYEKSTFIELRNEFLELVLKLFELTSTAILADYSDAADIPVDRKSAEPSSESSTSNKPAASKPSTSCATQEAAQKAPFPVAVCNGAADTLKSAAARKSELRELHRRLKKVYMIGLRSTNPVLRSKFFAVYSRFFSKNIVARMIKILLNPDWKHIGDSFWLQQVLDLMLEVVDGQHTTRPCLVGDAAVLPVLASAAPQSPPPLLREKADDATIAPMDVLRPASEFYSRMKKVTTADMLSSLRGLVHSDPSLAYATWMSLFPKMWSSLDTNDQRQLAPPMIKLLRSQQLEGQVAISPNVPQCLLQSLGECDPLIQVPPPLLHYLAEAYTASHAVVPLLERLVDLFPEDDDAVNTLSLVYLMNGDRDLYAGLWHSRARSEGTRNALALQQQGQWSKAQQAFVYAMEAACGVVPPGGPAGTASAPTAATAMITAAAASGGSDVKHGQPGTAAVMKAGAVPWPEVAVWQREWAESCKQLAQWDVLTEWSRTIVHTDMLHQCLWKVPEWGTLKELLIRHPMKQSPELKVYQTFVALQDDKQEEAERHISEGVQMCLRQWAVLPENAVDMYVPLLQRFQQFVELQESSKVLEHISNISRSHTMPEQTIATIKTHFQTWQDRLPNPWEDMHLWGDIITWRNHIFTVIVNAFQSLQDVTPGMTPQLMCIGINETAWSVNMLARTARKQGMPDVCLNVLQKLYNFPTMDIQDFFFKIREQVKAYLVLPVDHMTGLNTILNTNIDHFNARQKAELFQLKGEFHRVLNSPDEANSAFSNSMSISNDFPTGWLSWGLHCDQVYAETKEVAWGECAVNCYVQAVRFGSERARLLLSRVLWFLSIDRDGTIAKTLEQYREDIPAWVWLQWLPQLLAALRRPEAPAIKAILGQLVKIYPQAVYYPLRTFVIQQRSISANAATAAAAAQAHAAKTAASVLPHQGQPVGTAPQGQIPQGQIPQGQVPQGQVPQGQVPQGQVPQGQVPQGQVPQNQVPQGQIPQGQIPQGQIPQGQVPHGQVPQGQIPQSQVPQGSLPTSAAPAGMTMTASTGPTPGVATGVVPNMGGVPQATPGVQAAVPGVMGATPGMTGTVLPGHTGTPVSGQHPAAKAPAPVTTSKPIGGKVLAMADELMRALPPNQNNVVSDMECISEELSQRLLPTPEEQLYAQLVDMLDRCCQQPPQNKDVPPYLVSRLEEISRGFFPPAAANSQSSRQSVLSEYKQDFQQDFSPGANRPTSLADLISRLRRWKKILGRRVQSLPRTFKLQSLSRRLVEFQSADVEIPGRYGDNTEPAPDHHPRLERFLPSVEVVRRHGRSHRRTAMLGSDGKTYYFVVENSVPAVSQRGDERMVQVARIINRRLRKQKCARSRGVALHHAALVPVGLWTRLVQDDPSQFTLMDVLEGHLQQRDLTSDAAVEQFRQLMVDKLKPDRSNQYEARLRTFQQVQTAMMPKNILQQFLVRSFDEPHVYAIMKRRIATHLGIGSLVGYVLGFGGRKPQNIVISRERGTVYHAAFRPVCNQYGILDSQEPVPFRLSPNIVTFLSPYALEGTFASVMAAGARCLLHPKTHVHTYLHLLWKDELTAWQSIRGAHLGLRGAEETEAKVTESIKKVTERIAQFAPADGRPEKANTSGVLWRKVNDLIAEASSPAQLSLADPTWHGWF